MAVPPQKTLGAMCGILMWSPRFYAWVLFNGLLLRPYLARLNGETSHLWGCPGIVDGPHNTTGLEVIVAGLGRSGTHGVNMALEMLGLKTYGTYESAFYMPEVYRKKLRQEHLVFMMRSCGVKAFVIEPHYDLLWKLLPVSPGARVILTTRDYDSWRTSNLQGTRTGWGFYLNVGFQATVASVALLCDWIPYAPLYRLARQGSSFMQNSFTTLLLENCGMAHWGTMSRNYYPDWNDVMINEPAYFHAYHSDVRFFVPPGQLLEFDIKRHGWAELARFLKRAPVGVGHLPRTNAGSAHHSALRLQSHPLRWASFWMLLASTVAANWLAFGVLWALLAGCLTCCGSCCRALGGRRSGRADPKDE